MINYIIADDDDLYRELTMQQLKLIPNIHCLAECENAIDAKSQIEQHNPDLLILDVEMPGLSGIQLAKTLKKLPLIIFISSHPTYAVDAFEVDAIDYLTKPVTMDRLIRAIDKAKVLTDIKAAAATSESFKKSDNHSFFIKEKNAYVKINFTEVIYFESLGDFVNIFLQKGEKKIALVSLKNLEQQLPAASFIRISRTYMVNKDKITAIDNSSVFLDTIQIPIGKTYSQTVLQAVMGNNFIKRFI